MHLIPLEDVPESPLREPACNQTVEDTHRDLVVAVRGMEVRRVVLAVQYGDNDSQEAADLWHTWILPRR